MRNHDKLIDTLTRSAQSVSRTPPTGWRVMMWIASALPAGALAGWQLHRAFTDWSQPGSLTAALALLLAFIIGTIAIFSAFNLSIAGRRSLKPIWLQGLIVTWLLVNLFNASHVPLTAGEFQDGLHCYLFMLTAGLPMMVISILNLHRTRALYPTQSLLLAGCGIAFMSLTLLSLCHSVVLELQDFLMHLVGIATLIGMTVLSGRRWVALN